TRSGASTIPCSWRRSPRTATDSLSARGCGRPRATFGAGSPAPLDARVRDAEALALRVALRGASRRGRHHREVAPFVEREAEPRRQERSLPSTTPRIRDRA